MKGWSYSWNFESIKARAWSRQILDWGYWVWPQYPNPRNLWSSGYPVKSISHSSCWRDNLSNFEFSNPRDGDNTNYGRNFLILNRTLSTSKRQSHFLTINALNLAFLFYPKLFYIWVWIRHQKTTKKFHCYHFLSAMILSFCFQ